MINAAGGTSSEIRYSPWGETRYTSGTPTTDRLYTGQREDSYINLYWYGSRWYDPALGRFTSPDSIVPDAHNPLDWDRYSYVRNNPINYTDPTGHWPEWVDWIMGAGCQYADDMSLGLFSMVSGDLDYNESQAFQDGRQAGRIASTVAATVDEVGGAAVAGAAAAGVLPTAGGSLAAAPVTGGTSLVVGGVVVAGEVVVGVAGATTAVYGGAVIAKIKGDPLQSGSPGRGLWELTEKNSSKFMKHDDFGNFYKSKSDGLWWVKDNAGHGGSAWKVYKETSKGLEWYSDADKYGDFITGKHKGPVGEFVPWKDLHGR